MGTAIEHPVPDRVKPSFVIFDIRALWRSALSARVPGCQNYKWRLNPVWHRMLYSCTHMATRGQRVNYNFEPCLQYNTTVDGRGRQKVPECLLKHRAGSQLRFLFITYSILFFRLFIKILTWSYYSQAGTDTRTLLMYVAPVCRQYVTCCCCCCGCKVPSLRFTASAHCHTQAGVLLLQ